jgi:hypothetical protein
MLSPLRGYKLRNFKTGVFGYDDPLLGFAQDSDQGRPLHKGSFPILRRICLHASGRPLY